MLSICKTMKKSFLMPFVFLSLAACMPPSESLFDYWLGQWTGPEGTSLLINEHRGNYEVVITNLDGPRHFPATIQGMGLRFTRDGVVETLHEGDGLATGMKWLAGKQRCLVVKTGEGYCRD
jgi:hypothetical protein